jgi:hypothetical protein
MGNNNGNNMSDRFTEDQKRGLADMLGAVFIEMRCIYHQSDQVHELAYTFHNLPKEMFGWGTWDAHAFRSRLEYYGERFPEGGPNYAAMLDKIFDL